MEILLAPSEADFDVRVRLASHPKALSITLTLAREGHVISRMTFENHFAREPRKNMKAVHRHVPLWIGATHVYALKDAVH
jgi:hypothetical protein